jgi:putative OPT family oligopeptide transporter
MVGTVSAAFVMAPVLTLLLNAYGFKGHESAKENPLIAAQANLIASVSKGVFEGGLPWKFVWLGMGLAIAVIVLDMYLVRRGGSFRTPVLAVMIGIYLPFELSVPIFAGGIIHQLTQLYHQRKNADKNAVESSNRRGLLFASGLITGEALLGIMLAIPIVISGKKTPLALLKEPVGAWPGIILLVGVGYWLYRIARGKAGRYGETVKQLDS